MSVTIFGILNIGFALYGFCMVLGGQMMRHIRSTPGGTFLTTMQSDPTFAAWSKIGTCFELGGGVVLLAAGIGLLLSQNWARRLSAGYSILDIIYILVRAVMTYPVMQAMMAQMSRMFAGLQGVIAAVSLLVVVFVTLLQLAYPVLLLIFMTRPKVMAAFEPELPAAPASGL
jgi:hypothetical protein